MTSVREIEKRIEFATADRPKEGWQPTLKEPSIARPGDAIPEDPIEHMHLMLEIALLALQMDKTRVVNFVLEQDFSNKNYHFVEGVGNSSAHTISHHQDNPAQVAEYVRVNRYLSSEVAHFVQKLDQVQESADTTLLDNSLVFFGSCMMDGNTHTRDELPIVLMGGKRTGLQYGVHDYDGIGEQSLGRLHVSIAQNMGLDVDRVGDQEEPLPGLFNN